MSEITSASRSWRGTYSATTPSWTIRLWKRFASSSRLVASTKPWPTPSRSWSQSWTPLHRPHFRLWFPESGQESIPLRASIRPREADPEVGSYAPARSTRGINFKH